MHLSEIPQKLGQTRTVLLLGASMLAMLVFGMFLANAERGQLVDETRQLQHSISNLQTENEQLQTQANQLDVKLELAEMRAEQLKQEVVRLEEVVFNLQKDKAFYQHVVAPETTQDGFFIDGLELFPTTTDGYFKATMVLLQQRAVSAIVRGDLKVAVTGIQNGKHRILTSDDNAILPEGNVTYGFKYFQPVTLYLQLPENFVPESIEFTTTVYQFKRRRGDYQRSYNWQEILVADQ
ncbi:MAG: hypothetical protein GYB58_02335 [Gammaproteobacteria bacterium]|nr:hypothetical protein [Gammaproteobacteria bacterium]